MLGIRHRNKNKRQRLHIACCCLFCLLDGSKPPSLRNPNSHCPHKDLRLRSQQSTTYTHGSLRVATESQYTENQRYTVWLKNKASLHRKQGFF